MPEQSFSKRDLYLISAATAIVIANAYYVHPIIARVGEHFSVSDAWIGIVPAMNQLALALGIFLLLPLGDWIGNRWLVTIFTIGQFLSVVGMAISNDFRLFVVSSSVLGFFTITPYLIPAYVSKRIPQESLGHATAILTTGVIVGILVARSGAGVIGEYFGWRTVYLIASILMLIVSIIFPLILDDQGEAPATEQRKSYFGLLATLPKLVKENSHVLLSGTIQGLGFGTFICVWMGIALNLEDQGYGVDIIGYLALLALVNMITTPRLGRWADQTGARRARMIASVFRLLGMSLFFFSGNNIGLLMIPILIVNISGPIVDVSGRMTFLNAAPDIRTRLMTVYIILMFIGGGVASWIGTAAYAWAGWMGNISIAFAMAVLILALSAYSHYTFKAARPTN